MFKNGKGETLLQFIKATLILFLFLGLTSCATDKLDASSNINDIKMYFNGGFEEDWLKGLGYIKNNTEQGHLALLVTLFLDDKYSSIHDRVGLLIIDFFNREDFDISVLLNYIKTSNDSKAICMLVDNLNNDYILSFSEAVYKSNIDMRLKLIEDLGRYVLDYQNVLYLYFLNNKSIKSGVLSSSGFINDDDIYDWLVDRLYEADEEISSGAVFALSKHGTKGFSFLAKNLVFLSNRLKLITIDLLSFNKVEEAYSYYARLLINPSQLITERVLNSYKELGLKGVDYILDALTICHPGVKLQLLELLDLIPGTDYLASVTFLLEYPDIQEYIIDLYYQKNAIGIIKDLLLKGYYSVEDKVVDYGIKNRSTLLFYDQSLESFTLEYFLENYDSLEVKEYLRVIGQEENYIEDYDYLVDIYADLQIVDSFGELNREVEYVTRYFELEQKKSISQQESKLFYQNMESWLETGDQKYLDSSQSLKNADNPNASVIETEKQLFYDSIEPANVLSIIEYEDAIKNIKNNYRKLTFRLKDFGDLMISDKGYDYLIE